MNEVELKFIEIAVADVKERLQKAGAKLVSEGDLKMITFMKEGFDRKDSTKHYLRVRKEHNDTRITYKSPASKDSSATSRSETEVVVDDYDNAVALFEQLGFTADEPFTKHREHYELGDWHYEIDTVPGIPTYLEVEAQSEEGLHDACKAIALDVKDGKKGTIFEIYDDR